MKTSEGNEMLEAGRRDCFVVRKETTKCASTKQSS